MRLFFQAIKGLDNSQSTAASLKDSKTKILDNSMAQMLSTQIQLNTKVSCLQDELEQMTENTEKTIKITESSLDKDIKESNENMHILYERLNTKEKQMVKRVENIVKELEEFQNWQHNLTAKFNSMETIVKESKKEKEEYEKDVKSFCSQIQDSVDKHIKRITALENQSIGFDETLHEVLKNVDSIRATAGI